MQYTYHRMFVKKEKKKETIICILRFLHAPLYYFSFIGKENEIEKKKRKGGQKKAVTVIAISKTRKHDFSTHKKGTRSEGLIKIPPY